MNPPSLEQKVAFLRSPDSHPERPSQVDAIETHMSWLFLTERSVFKLKKPIRYDRLDFSTLRLRRFYCEEEVRLNRRLAGKVYRGVLPLTRDGDGTLAVDGLGTPVDWLVHMERLPASRMLDWILARRVVERSEVRGAAIRLAQFYARANRVALSAADLVERLAEGIRTDERELCRPEFELPGERIRSIASSQLDFLKDHARLFEDRVDGGRIVDGHGDLRPEHICLIPEPVIIDCLEFCQELREQDPADELAFLALECERLGQPRVGEWFIEAYDEGAGDRLPRPLLQFYRNYRILRRAKIAAWHLNDPATRDRERYAETARRYLDLARPLRG